MMKSRQLQFLFFGLITIVGCLVFINVEVLDGALSVRRRRADDVDAADAVSLAIANALRNQALSGSELLALLNAQQVAQATAIANLTAHIDVAVKLQRQLVSGQPGAHRVRGRDSCANAERRDFQLARSRSPMPRSMSHRPLPAAHVHGVPCAGLRTPDPPTGADTIDARPRVVRAPAALSGEHAKATTPYAVVIFAFNRPEYLQRALRSVVLHLPTDGSYTLVVSQDGDEPGVSELIEREGGAHVLHLHHPRSNVVLDAKQRRFKGYYCLAQHYGWALGELLDRLGFEDVLILEDDIEVAPDLFAYFKAMRPLLDADPTLLTISVRARSHAEPRRAAARCSAPRAHVRTPRSLVPHATPR
jgi:hypothetical protein